MTLREVRAMAQVLAEQREAERKARAQEAARAQAQGNLKRR